MRSILKKSTLLLTAVFFLALPAQPLAAFNPLKSACDKVRSGQPNGTFNSSACAPSGNGDPVVHVIHVSATIIAMLAGIAAVIIIIVSGITMITSAGNSEAVGTARKRITGAVIGLIIIALAYLIVTFFVDKLIS